jgi:hypothetical protein
MKPGGDILHEIPVLLDLRENRECFEQFEEFRGRLAEIWRVRLPLFGAEVPSFVRFAASIAVFS